MCALKVFHCPLHTANLGAPNLYIIYVYDKVNLVTQRNYDKKRHKSCVSEFTLASCGSEMVVASFRGREFYDFHFCCVYLINWTFWKNRQTTLQGIDLHILI